MQGSQTSPELITKVFELLANGRTATSACKEVGISFSALYNACNRNGETREAYARAQQSFFEAIGYEIMDIADTTDGDPHNKRVRIDARREYLGAFVPAWSKKISVELTNKGDARLAEQRADQRLLRYQDKVALGQVIEVIPTLLPCIADTQSANAIDNPPEVDAPSIFS